MIEAATSLGLCAVVCSVASGMSNSLLSDGLQPARLLCPWDSPGKNNRVGSHLLLQGIFPTQGSNTSLKSPALARGLFTTSTTWEASLGLSVQSLSHVRLFATPWTQGFPVLTNSWSLLRLMSIELVMPSNHLILCCSLLLLSSVLPSIRIFSSESVLHIKWPKYWSM